MAYNIPTSGQWVTFPVDIELSAEVQWMENSQLRSNTYYVTKCFWGPLDKVPFTPTAPKELTGAELAKLPETAISLPPTRPWPPKRTEPSVLKADEQKEKKVKVLGSTDLFVAKELFVEHFAGGSLSPFHLKDLTKDKWITMKLDASFHYGQNGSFGNLQRFLVYHPLSPPKIFQHRFVGLKAVVVLNAANQVASTTSQGLSAAGISLVPPELTEIITNTKDAILQVIESLKSVIGDYLHQFLDQTNLDDAKTLWESQMKRRQSKLNREAIRKKLLDTTAALKSTDDDPRLQGLMGELGKYTLSELSEEELYVLCIQIIESAIIARDNKSAREGLEARLRTEEARLKRIIPAYQAQATKTSVSPIQPPKMPIPATKEGDPVKEEGFWSGIVNYAVDICRSADKEMDMKEAQAKLAVAMQKLRASQQADDAAVGGVVLTAEANGLQVPGTEGRMLIEQRRRLRRSLSNPDLKPSASGNLVGQSLGGAKTSSPAMDRAVQQPPRGSG